MIRRFNFDVKKVQSSSDIDAIWSKYDFICCKFSNKKLIYRKDNDSYLRRATTLIFTKIKN